MGGGIIMGLDMYLYEKETHQVASWRKANAIHGWIINYTNAIDNCTPITLQMRDLIELQNVCKEVLLNPEKAQDLLPPTPGFFFGSYEIDEWYWDSVKDTTEKLTNIIKENEEDATFEYQASW
jgi:hypothetical protein